MKQAIKAKDLKELQRIQASIPKELSDRLVTERASTPTMAKVLSMALHRKDLTEEQREKLQTVWDSGVLHQKEQVVNRTIEKRIDTYLTTEINKSIAAGRLSPYAKKDDIQK